MTKRKFVSEFGLNMLPDDLFLLQQDDLDLLDQLPVSPHIYMIGRRPRISLKPGSIVVSEDRVAGEFQKQIKGEFVPIPFDVPNQLGTDDVTIECEYPFTELVIVDAHSKAIGSGKCASLLTSFGRDFHEHLDLEILYVGQAYGTDGERTALDRLKKHETLQGIYAEAMRLSPDQDIWLLLLTFQEPWLLASFDGRKNQEIETSDEQDEAHRKNVLNRVVKEEITEQQRINFTEAALIRYFQPSYNTIYKDNFPSSSHTTYSECYDIDLNLVSVELSTTDINTRLWSESVDPTFQHFCTFPLHSREARVAMFDLFPSDQTENGTEP